MHLVSICSSYHCVCAMQHYSERICRTWSESTASSTCQTLFQTKILYILPENQLTKTAYVFLGLFFFFFMQMLVFNQLTTKYIGKFYSDVERKSSEDNYLTIFFFYNIFRFYSIKPFNGRVNNDTTMGLWYIYYDTDWQ